MLVNTYSYDYNEYKKEINIYYNNCIVATISDFETCPSEKKLDRLATDILFELGYQL